jgi:hypothetical protein
MQVPATPPTLQVGGGAPLLDELELLLDELLDELLLDALPLLDELELLDELLLEELELLLEELELLLEELELLEPEARAIRSSSVPLKRSMSTWWLVTPAMVPEPVYCQKSHLLQLLGIWGQDEVLPV